MKVDLPSLIIGICALATFAVPIAWYQISEKHITKKLSGELKSFADQHGLTLTNFEVWGDKYAIGLDQKAKKLLYFQKNPQGDSRQMIDLNEVQKCDVSNGTKTGVTKNIRLLFHYRASGKSLTSLEIYDSENGKSITYEISIANKWANTANSFVKSRSKTSYKIPLV